MRQEVSIWRDSRQPHRTKGSIKDDSRVPRFRAVGYIENCGEIAKSRNYERVVRRMSERSACGNNCPCGTVTINIIKCEENRELPATW